MIPELWICKADHLQPVRKQTAKRQALTELPSAVAHHNIIVWFLPIWTKGQKSILQQTLTEPRDSALYCSLWLDKTRSKNRKNRRMRPMVKRRSININGISKCPICEINRQGPKSSCYEHEIRIGVTAQKCKESSDVSPIFRVTSINSGTNRGRFGAEQKQSQHLHIHVHTSYMCTHKYTRLEKQFLKKNPG